MAKFNERLRSLRLERNLSQQELSDQLKLMAENPKGYSKSSINMYERGDREPGLETLETIADYFNVDMDFLLGKTDIQNRFVALHDNSGDTYVPKGFRPLPRTVRRPLVGRIACGEPITAEENIEDYVDVPEGCKCDFCLLCEGDSMVEANIMDGDIVYIRSGVDVHNGEIAAVRIGDEATLKRVYLDKEKSSITLVPANTHYAPKTFSGEELAEIHIEGKVVGFTHWFE